MFSAAAPTSGWRSRGADAQHRHQALASREDLGLHTLVLEARQQRQRLVEGFRCVIFEWRRFHGIYPAWILIRVVT